MIVKKEPTGVKFNSDINVYNKAGNGVVIYYVNYYWLHDLKNNIKLVRNIYTKKEWEDYC